MSVVIYTNKKTGKKYAYENESYWVPELKQARNRRKYLGRVDDDGNIIPSSGKRGRPSGTAETKKDDGYREKYLRMCDESGRKDARIAQLEKENADLREAMEAIGRIVSRQGAKRQQ